MRVSCSWSSERDRWAAARSALAARRTLCDAAPAPALLFCGCCLGCWEGVEALFGETGLPATSEDC